MIRRRLYACATLTSLWAMAWPTEARGNGAFPAGLSLSVPPHRPNAIIIATNFGLVISEDRGDTWMYTCEDPERDQDARLYSFTETSDNIERIFAVGPQGLAVTETDGCTWASTAASANDVVAVDYFVDPTNPQRLAIIASHLVGQDSASTLYLSDDGGRTLGAPRPSQGIFQSVEIAAKDPQVIYTIESLVGAGSRFNRSTDGGITWSFDPLPDDQGPSFTIITADPTDAQKVFLRATNFASDRILLTDDGGHTWTTVFDEGAETVVTAFLRRANGTILVGGRDGGGTALGFRSTDGGRAFAPWDTQGLHVRGLVETNQSLYALTEDFLDPFALAVSEDEGGHWEPVLAYKQIAAIKPCARERCAADCARYADLGLFPAATCSAKDPAMPSDGGSDATGQRRGGGGCSVAAGDGVALAQLADVAAAAWLLLRRRRTQ